MKKIAPALIAAGLAATFAAAAPAAAQNPDPAARAIEATDAARQRRHDELQRLIATRAAAAPGEEIRDAFESAVRGCTLDGYIYRLTYNITIDPNDAMAAYRRMITPDGASLLGVRGSSGYFELLRATLATANSGAQSVLGATIDEASADIITAPAFDAAIAASLREIEESVARRHGLRVKIEAGEAREQGGRCPAAALPPATTPATIPAAVEVTPLPPPTGDGPR